MNRMLTERTSMDISTPDISTNVQAIAESKKYRVVLGFQGDGYHGKYDPNVVEEDGQLGDKPCLRLEIFVKDKSQWKLIDFGSFVTYLLATDSQEQIQSCVDFVMGLIKENKNKVDNDFLEKIRYIHLRNGKPHVAFPARD